MQRNFSLHEQAFQFNAKSLSRNRMLKPLVIQPIFKNIHKLEIELHHLDNQLSTTILLILHPINIVKHNLSKRFKYIFEDVLAELRPLNEKFKRELQIKH